MMKRLLSLMLMLGLLLCAAVSLGEEAPSLSAEQIRALQRLAGEDGTLWQEGTPPSADMNAFQVWQWTDWFLSNRVRSLLGVIQDYQRLDAGTPPDAQVEKAQWQLRELENTLSRFETQLEEDRLAILNGISLCQSSETSQADRLTAYHRILEAESELRQIITSICQHYSTYLATVNDCESKLHPNYDPYASSLAQAASNLAASENAAGADFTVSVVSTYQLCIRVCDPDGNPVNGAAVTVTNQLNNARKQATTDSKGNAVFWVGDLGADETNELRLNLRVEATGYRTREAQTVRLRGGKTRTVALQKDNGEPYLVMGCFDGRDILTETNTYFSSADNTANHAFTVKLHCGSDGELVLRYPVDAKAEEYRSVVKPFSASDSDHTVLVFEDQWLQKLIPGAKVSLTIKTGGMEYTTDTLLVIQKPVVEKPILSGSALFSLTGGSDSLGLSIPKELPFIGGSSLSLDIPDSLSQAVYLPSYRALYALGYDFKPEQAGWQTRDAEDEARAVKEFEVKGKADEALATAGAHRDINTTVQSKLLGEQSAYVTPFAALQGQYDAKNHTLELGGTAGAAMAFHTDISQIFSIGLEPFYAGMTVDMGAGFGLDVTSAMQLDVTGNVPAVVGNPKPGYESVSSVSFKMDMRTTSGMGVRDDVTVDVSGYGSLAPTADFARGSASAALDMGMNATVRKLFTRWKSVAWEGKLDLPHSSGTVPGVPMAEAYLHFSNEDLKPPFESSSTSNYGTSGVEPYETEQLLRSLDSATGNFQYVVIGGDTYLFWIQPEMATNYNKVQARVWYQNLNNMSIYGGINWLSNSTHVRGQYADYDFAVEVSREADNQGSSFCALTILSGQFSSTGSGTSVQAPDQSILATVVMKQNSTKGLDIVFYREHTKVFEQDDYAVMPEVCLTATGDSEESVRIVSTCSGSSQNAIYGQMIYNKKTGLDGLVELDPASFSDENSIARYHVGLSDAAGQRPEEMVSIYSLSRKDDAGFCELSRISYGQRTLLATGDITNFRVYAQTNTYSATDRLFYLERVELEEGKYTQRLKSWIDSAAGPVITDYDVEIIADSFDIARFGPGVYLYWTECSAPADAAGQGIAAENLVRCVRYDPGTNTVSGPFSLVELSERPNSVTLLDGGTGYYSVAMERSGGSRVRQSLSRFTYTLVSAAELTSAAPTNPSVRAGDYAEIVFSVRNTGNAPLSAFDVKLYNGSQELQTLHIDCINPENNSSTMGTKTISGAQSVSRISSLYDPLNHDSWNIVQTQAGRNTAARQVQTDMLMPGDMHSYTAKLLVPADWAGGKSLTAVIDSVEGTPALSGVAKNGTLTLTGADDASIPTVTRPCTVGQTLNTDVHDLSLSAQLFQRSGADYVHISITNLSGNTESTVTPVLTASYRGETLFSHAFHNPLKDDFGYSMDIPLTTLTKGRNLPELELHVSSRNDTQYEEFADSDNHVRLMLSIALYIAEQPEDVSTIEGQEAAFSVTAGGGEQPYRYQWQRLTGENQWENIPGAEQDTYRIESVKTEQNGLTVRCVVTDQFGDSVTSDPAMLTVGLFIVKHPESISVSNGQEAAFSVTVSGGVKPYRYQWQRMTGENQWANIPGAAQDTYRIPSVTSEQNGLPVRCVVTDQRGDSVTSDAATLTVELFIAKQPESISVSNGQEAAFSVTADGGKQPYRYQWQRLTGENQWESIPGAEQDTYRIPSVTSEQNGLTVRCVVTDQRGDSVTSDTATLTVELFIAKQPESISVSNGQEAAFSVTADGGVKPYRYQWQRLTEENQWTDIQGAEQDSYRIPSVTSEQNGLTVRCVVTDQRGDSVTSDSATLTVGLFIVKHPESISVPNGQEAAFSVTADGGVKPYRYQWQRMTGENQWANIPGAAQDTYRIPSVTSEQNGLTGRCVVTDQRGDSVTSDAATLTVELFIVKQPESISVPNGQEAAFSVTADGGVKPYRYQWQRLTGENQWTDIQGAAQDTYRIPSVTGDQNSLTVRCVVTDQRGDSVTSDAATLTVGLFIVKQPESISVPNGQEAAFSVTADGGVKPYHYQWQRLTGENQWTDISGANQDTYRIPSVTREQNGLTVRCVVTDHRGNSVTSDTATLTVGLFIAKQPESISVPNGQEAAFSVTADGGKQPYRYQWQRLTGENQWTDIPGAAQDTYRIPSVTSEQNGLTVRCVVTDHRGNSVTSDTATLTVGLFIAKQPESISVPNGQEAAFSVTADGGKQPYRYQWQRLTGENQWANIPGAAQDTYRIPSVTSEQNGLTVRCVVTDQRGDSVTSDAATLTVGLFIVKQPESISVPNGQEAAFSVTADGGVKPYRYQWQRLTGENQWANIPGAAQDTYRIPSVTSEQNGLTVRCVVTDQRGDSVTSDPAMLTVGLFIVKHPESISVPNGQEAAFSVTADGGKQPYRYQWQRLTGENQWTDISGANQDTYRIPSVTSEQNGLTVRCVVTDQRGDSVTSDSATLFILPQTGDRSQLTLWLLLALSSMAVLVMVCRKRCRR